jgi:hypothetical protein
MYLEGNNFPNYNHPGQRARICTKALYTNSIRVGRGRKQEYLRVFIIVFIFNREYAMCYLKPSQCCTFGGASKRRANIHESKLPIAFVQLV